MFKFSILLLLLSLTIRGFAQCPPAGNLTLSSQAEVDLFGTQYGTCANMIISGDLMISGPDITSLAPLANLASVLGTLTIQDNTSLANLQGLNQVTSLGSLLISGNNALTEISALGGTTSVSGDLVVEFNDVLTSVNGLQNITAVGSGLEIIQNSILTNIDDLSKVSTVGGNLNINFNPKLTSINGLQALTSVGGQLFVGFNDVLENGGSWPELANVQTGLNFVGNAKLISLPSMPKLITISGNLFLTSNAKLQSLSGLSNLESVTALLLIDQNVTLTNLTGLDKLKAVGPALQISKSTALTSLQGLGSLETINGELAIFDNDQLTSLGGLSKLNAINALSIVDNAVLSRCEIAAVYFLLQTDPTQSFIVDNAPGCNTVEEILAAGAALPVTLMSFSGKLIEANTVHLTWTTSSEWHSDHFEVQRKTIEDDWLTLGTVATTGNTSAHTNYRFNDLNPDKGHNLYRLKMVDQDGSFACSKLVSVTTKFAETVFVYPNPAGESLSVSSPSTITGWKMISTEGKTLGQQKTDQAHIDLYQLKSGPYIIEVATRDGETHTVRFVKQ